MVTSKDDYNTSTEYQQSTDPQILCIAGKFGKLSAIHQTKLVHKINNLLADLLICQMLETNQFTKLSRYTVVKIVGNFVILTPHNPGNY